MQSLATRRKILKRSEEWTFFGDKHKNHKHIKQLELAKQIRKGECEERVKEKEFIIFNMTKNSDIYMRNKMSFENKISNFIIGSHECIWIYNYTIYKKKLITLLLQKKLIYLGIFKNIIFKSMNVFNELQILVKYFINLKIYNISML